MFTKLCWILGEFSNILLDYGTRESELENWVNETGIVLISDRMPIAPANLHN